MIGINNIYFSILLFLLSLSLSLTEAQMIRADVGLLSANIAADVPSLYNLEGDDPLFSPIVNDEEDDT